MQALFHPPNEIDAYGPWLGELREWRGSARGLTGHRNDRYLTGEANRLRQTFSIFLVNVWDRELLSERGRLDPQPLQARIDREYGGTDILMLWNGYPRIGLDERNQFDFWRDLPGGLGGVRELIATLQERGLKVAIPYLPWDGDTARPKPAEELLVELVEYLEPDVLFLDTLSSGDAALMQRLDAARPGLLYMPEALPDESRLSDHVLSWMQGQREGAVPGVIRNRFFEQRHMLFEVRRWQSDHQAELQRAWLNGTGTVIWENVFGTWVGTTERFRRSHRLMRGVHRRLSDLLTEGEWTPVAPLGPEGVYASSWAQGDLRFYAVVNRSGAAVSGLTLPRRLDPPDSPAVHGSGTWTGGGKGDVSAGRRAFELTRGSELEVDGHGAVRLDLPGDFAGVLVAPEAFWDQGWRAFLQEQVAAPRPETAATSAPEAAVRNSPAAVLSSRDAVAGEERRRAAGMTFLRGGDSPRRESTISYRVRECHFLPGVDDFHWLDGKHLTRQVPYRLSQRRFMIARTPVTNAQFARFLGDSGYVPADATNYLRHWGGSTPPAALAGESVVWVSPAEARACAAWYGGRLPTLAEWQQAAEAGRADIGPEGAPLGRSGLELGRVWELTDPEYDDGHTRFIMLRGGSVYRAEGSVWYFDGGPRPTDWASKMILFGPGIDRAATVGFRIVYDLS